MSTIGLHGLGVGGGASGAGTPGADGADGADGIQGFPGIDGEDGFDGFPGLQGPMGPAGTGGNFAAIYPATTSVLSTGMLGLSSGISIITPVSTGVVVVMITGYRDHPDALSNITTISAKYGTGTGPAHGATATGTTFITQTLIETVSRDEHFSFAGIVQGLALGVPVWFDIALLGANSMVVTAPSIVAFEYSSASFQQFVGGVPGLDAEEPEGPWQIPGQPGNPGATGPQGPSGAIGFDGLDGEDGADGIPGVTGAPGADGMNGINGVMGPPGQDAEEPEFPYIIPGERGATGAAGGGGGGTSGTATLNFGVFPGASDAFVPVASAGIGAGDLPYAWVLPAITADHSVNEHMLETLEVFAHSVVVGVGFSISGFNRSELFEPLERFKGERLTTLAGAATVLATPGLQLPTRGGIGTRLYGTWNIGWRY